MKVLIMIRRTFILCFLLFFAHHAIGQNTVLESGTIDEQFEFVFDQSESYRDFKVIKQSKLRKLKTNLKDSISLIKSNLSKANTKISQNNNEATTLKNNLSSTQADLDHAIKEKDSFNFLGMLIKKTIYNILMWTLVAGLLAFTLFFIYQFRNSHVVTAKTQSSLDEVNKKFDEYKKKTLVKEQELMRELQDYKNKYR